jgi:hypothetical protein
MGRGSLQAYLQPASGTSSFSQGKYIIMKNQADDFLTPTGPSDDEIRTYAHHLYQQSNCRPGHDLDNWLEAIACLRANIPPHLSATRLHRHVSGPDAMELEAVTMGARTFLD